MKKVALTTLLAASLVIAGAIDARASSIVFSAAGSNAAAIQGTVDAFRAALGPLNPNVVGSFASGRREINWDGVPNALAAPNNLPANFFNANSPRGVEFSTPGTGFQVSANAGFGPIEFDNLDPLNSSRFTTFSAQRLFTALGSNITDVNFFVAGSGTQATTTAFGVVFTDVDVANTTGLQFFDVGGNSLGTFFAPNAIGDETLSFLGVQFSGVSVGRVRITSGNGNDAVVMDDFIYAEAQAVPEPSTLLLTVGGLALVARRVRRRAV